MGRAVVFNPSIRFRQGRATTWRRKPCHDTTPTYELHQFLGQVFGVPPEMLGLGQIPASYALEFSRRQRQGCPCIQYLLLTSPSCFESYDLSMQTLLGAKSLTSLNLKEKK
ncbi:hypothetical protein L3X38_043774 [Prunus dulcis]|uniref:Uncharacterized protein n=1 Tax=Prunus dulcis TaxID=3755 RepID=A0AAD4UXP8_PRUDU|nr:hypothetical protein L3X38_043774 [Prunus dulcis]